MSRIDVFFLRSKAMQRLSSTAAIAALGILFGCTAPSAPAQVARIPPPPPGKARIWIYSDWRPYGPESQSYIRINGARVGVFAPGYTLYRDVTPGPYTVGVESEEPFHDQVSPVAVIAGQQVYMRVEPWRDCNGGSAVEQCYTNFSIYLQPPQIGAAAVAFLPFSGR